MHTVQKQYPALRADVAEHPFTSYMQSTNERTRCDSNLKKTHISHADDMFSHVNLITDTESSALLIGCRNRSTSPLNGGPLAPGRGHSENEGICLSVC